MNKNDIRLLTCNNLYKLINEHFVFSFNQIYHTARDMQVIPIRYRAKLMNALFFSVNQIYHTVNDIQFTPIKYRGKLIHVQFFFVQSNLPHC